MRTKGSYLILHLVLVNVYGFDGHEFASVAIKPEDNATERTVSDDFSFLPSLNQFLLDLRRVGLNQVELPLRILLLVVVDLGLLEVGGEDVLAAAATLG